jgi:hypothetical protein
MPTVAVCVYDAGEGSSFADRYSVFDEISASECLSLSANADSPQGVCTWVEADEKDFDGRIPLSELPAGAYRALVKRLCASYGAEVTVIDNPAGREVTLAVTAPLGPRSRLSPLAARVYCQS